MIGAQLTVFFVASYHIIGWSVSVKKRTFWLSFLCLLTAIATVNLACSIKFNRSAWIDERNYPGGPFDFLIQQQSRPILTVGNTASILGSFLADGILLYRVMILWDFIWYIIIPPTLFYIACVILSILTVIQIAAPDSTHIVNLSFPVWLVLMIINIILSAMIVVRILMMRRDVKSGLGAQYARPYGIIAAIVVEAALPFTILSIILLVLFGNQNTAQNLFVPLLVQVECLVPSLIIIRVIIRGSQDNTLTKPSSALRFAPPLGMEAFGQEDTWTNSGGLERSKINSESSEDSPNNTLHSQ
ncbi:hypothetical protein C0989_009563 [Termitomyces sp. Mn162]|nr:hypothetical protein C0989_009563 [Termitomyces sp. Mn162]